MFNDMVFEHLIHFEMLMIHIIHQLIQIRGQPIVSNIPMAKVAIRLYINLYTTSDGRPPNNIQINLVSRLSLLSLFRMRI